MKLFPRRITLRLSVFMTGAKGRKSFALSRTILLAESFGIHIYFGDHRCGLS